MQTFALPNGAKRPTRERVCRMLSEALAAGVRMEVDVFTDGGRITYPVGSVETLPPDQWGNRGFRLRDTAGNAILDVAGPTRGVDWFLPHSESRDGWARIRIREYERLYGNVLHWTKTHWVRFSER